MNEVSSPKNGIAITGASGFVGQALVERLIKETDYHLNCLSRRDKSHKNNERITWKKCDLFSMLDIENALEGCDIAVYLVHSMLPSAHLTQATFDNLDLILADNFIRACQKKNIKKIVYLSGIIPESENLSDHLRSRLEVERTLASTEIPLTTLRAGLILGPGGSSSSMVINLVKNLPMMVLPKWTETLSNPVALPDAIEALQESILQESILQESILQEEHQSQTYDLGGPEVLSYQDLIRRVAKLMGKKRYFFSVPFVSQSISKNWVSLITGAPSSLVTPLIYSLSHHMVINPRQAFPFHRELMSIDDVLKQCLEYHTNYTPHAYGYTGEDQNLKEVRSVQRLETVMRTPANQVAKLYMEWLPKLLNPFIKVTQKENSIYFKLAFIRIPLLILHFSEKRSSPDRQLFYIKGGLLAYGKGRGRLEFRDVLGSRYTLAGIHEFHPRLPWYIYKYTQALIHLWVMKRFNIELLRKKY